MYEEYGMVKCILVYGTDSNYEWTLWTQQFKKILILAKLGRQY
jgi:hypothetical protein